MTAARDFDTGVREAVPVLVDEIAGPPSHCCEPDRNANGDDDRCRHGERTQVEMDRRHTWNAGRQVGDEQRQGEPRDENSCKASK